MFVGMEEKVKSFRLYPVAEAKKLFEIQIPAGIFEIFEKMICIYQNADEETGKCTEEAFENKIENQAESQGSSSVIS